MYPSSVTGVDLSFLKDCAIRGADEGVPIGALKRIFRPDPDLFREMLHDAVHLGQLLKLPPEDWPPGSARAIHVDAALVAPTIDEAQVKLKMASKFRTTPQEGCVLLVLLRRDTASRAQLHAAVEANRGNPDDETDEKIVDVVIFKLRKKLTPHNINIHTLHAFGYQITARERKLAWAIIEGTDPCP